MTILDQIFHSVEAVRPFKITTVTVVEMDNRSDISRQTKTPIKLALSFDFFISDSSVYSSDGHGKYYPATLHKNCSENRTPFITIVIGYLYQTKQLVCYTTKA